MDRGEIEGALEDLGLELEARGQSARLFLVGGAVMVLDFGRREATDDVDGGIYPADKVLAAAAEVGRRRGLRPEWLNDAAKIYIPVFKQPDWRPVKRVGTLEMFTADARAMLAMKLRASRGRRDEADISFLLHECGTEEQGRCGDPPIAAGRLRTCATHAPFLYPPVGIGARPRGPGAVMPWSAIGAGMAAIESEIGSVLRWQDGE
jgi:hypothetical protein